MPYITATGIAKPPYAFQQSDVKPFVRDMFSEVFPDIDRLLKVFENTQIDTRYFCVPIDWFGEPRKFAEKSRLYIENALKLGIEALQNCLQHAQVGLDAVNHLFFVSTSGLATPSMDARILNQLQANPHTKRTPIWGLGCAGGAAGLSRACDYVKAHPKETAAVIAVELCGLTFQRNDLTKSNLVATSLFADGAACVLVAGDESAAAAHHSAVSNKLRLRGTMSTLWKDSLDVMGWNFSDAGFHVVFSRDIPSIVRNDVSVNTQAFYAQQGIQRADHYVLHPGGTKVLDAYRESLGIPADGLQHSEAVLREYGNMSSCTVLYVLDRFMQSGIVRAGETALITALGPGFSSEMLLAEGV